MDLPPKNPLFSLLENSQQRNYPKGQIILYQGDAPTHLFVIKQGEVKLYDVDEQGNEKILHILRPPAMFPLASYSGKQPDIMWFYGALTDTDVYLLPFDELESRMKDDATLDLYLLERLVKEVHELCVRLDSLSKTTSRSKLIAALKFLSAHHAEVRKNGWRRVTFTVNHQLLADMAGITRESAAMAMKQLQDEHVTRAPRVGILEIHFDKLIVCT
jgi:CRP/FNR family transcriptional regulator